MQTPPGRRERRRERVRGALLDAAMVLFAERGLHGTRVEDITQRADLGKGAFYNYFESKDALTSELLLTAIEHLEREYLVAAAEGGVEARIEALVRAHDRFFAEHPEYAVLFHQARGLLQVERADPSKLRRIFGEYLARIGARLHPEGDGAISAEERMNVAALVVGAIAGYRSYCLAAGLAPVVGTVAGPLASWLPAHLAGLVGAGSKSEPGGKDEPGGNGERGRGEDGE
ncbi:MAG: TetR/AcrR family transcriptional regulator [Polyangiaceae bacterium]